MPSRIRSLSLGLSLALALCGCVPTEDVAEPPRPTVTPVFASGEEALAAATEAYARFVRVGDEVGQSGGEGLDRLATVATGEFLELEIEGFTKFRESGWRSLGTTIYRDMILQQFNAGPMAAVVVYVCEDISATDVVDASGLSIVTSDRQETNYFQVAFDVDGGNLKVASRQRWDDRTC